MKHQLLIVLCCFVATSNLVYAATAEKATAPPSAWIVSTSPAIGATDVDPKLAEITVTFDRDMSEDMSWTGDEKDEIFPADPEEKGFWKDKRTCVLPVKLKRGKYYRVGINSKSFQNFKSTEGQAAPCSVIYFVTRGADKAVQSRTRAPQITKMVPDNGATDVDPAMKAIRITFTVPMGKGMSWVGGGASFPEGLADQKPKWTSDGRTCILPVTLKSDNQYKLGLNSLQHVNFQSKWGVPLAPVVYEFKTSASSE